MAEIHAKVVPDSPEAQFQSRKLMAQENMKGVRLVDFTQDANVSRAPDYYLYVYNISRRQFNIARPPCFPHVKLSACPEGQPYVKVMKVGNVVNEKWVDDNSQVRNNGIMAERFLTDLLNPTNLGINCWQEVTDDQMSWIDAGGTNDLTRRGLFWSRNEEPGRTCMVHGGVKQEILCPYCFQPTHDELELAKTRMQRHYRQLIAQADKYWRDNQRMEIGPEHHMAGDYFKVKAEWHTIAELPSICPNCGEAVHEGLKFHTTAAGVICVNPTQEGWRAAVNAGVKTKDQVPEDFKW